MFVKPKDNRRHIDWFLSIALLDGAVTLAEFFLIIKINLFLLFLLHHLIVIRCKKMMHSLFGKRVLFAFFKRVIVSRLMKGIQENM